MAVPITVKMPEPMTAPIPSAVSETGPSVFFRLHSGNSESLINLSIDLVANSCCRSASAPGSREWRRSIRARYEQMLTLALTSGKLLDLLLGGASWGSACSFGSRFFARGSLDLLPLQLVFDCLCIGHRLPV